jgi:hypothetical protein
MSSGVPSRFIGLQPRPCQSRISVCTWVGKLKQGNAEIYVDIMGATDAPEGWQAAIDAGADGLQSDRPGPLVEYLRQKGYKK